MVQLQVTRHKKCQTEEEKSYLRSCIVTHFLVRRQALQLPFTKCNIPKHYSSNSSITTISQLCHHNWNSGCWNVFYSTLPDRHPSAYLPATTFLSLPGGHIKPLASETETFLKVLIRG